MFDSPFFQTSLFNLVILPILIFLARVCDVSIGTVRLMLLARGRKFVAPLLGFFEVLIWLIAVRQIMNNLSHWGTYVAFAGGFAVGNYVGMLIEERLAMGRVVIRIITKKEGTELFNFLKHEGYGVTSIDAQGSTGKVNVVFTIVNRKDMEKVVQIINRFNPKAFYTVEDVRSVAEGVFPVPKGRKKTLTPNN